MVYLKELLKENKERLIQFSNLEAAAYLSLTDSFEFENYSFRLTPEEEIAVKGYKGLNCDSNEIRSIINQPPKKGMSALTNIYKLAGLYLCDKALLMEKYKSRYDIGNIKEKYFLAKVESSFVNLLKSEIERAQPSDINTLVKRILGVNNISDTEINKSLLNVVANDIDIQTLLILEDLEKVLLKVSYINIEAEEMVRLILNNFSNAAQKIIRNRRKGHECFVIEDEYDVQDLLYVILKSVFPHLKDEDPTPKNGGKSFRIDLILRDEEILIEVKMLKAKDTSETKFIDELKVDFESYHESKWLKKLFCFVYDPYKKTRDIANFHDLNGHRTKGKSSFNVEVIVVN